MPADGLVPGLPWDDYLHLARVNWSTLKHLAKSPAHYRHALTDKEDDTDAKKVGRIVHLAAFEPERFRERVAIWDGDQRRGKLWDAFKLRNEGRELLREVEYERCMAIQAAVRADATAMRYVTGGIGETTMLWTSESPELGAVDGYRIECKGRVDFIGASALVDLKTTRDASPNGFGRQVWSYQYHVQAAWYVDAYEAITGERRPYVIVAVEQEAPHVVSVFTVPEHVLEAGREHYRALLDRLNLCKRESRWPGYAEAEVPLELPRWAIPNDEEDLTGLDLVINQ